MASRPHHRCLSCNKARRRRKAGNPLAAIAFWREPHKGVLWVNNGHIVPGVDGNLDQEIPTNGVPPNYSYGQITCQRDLENFFRLWICGVPSLSLYQNYTFTLSMRAASGNPAINIYTSVETNGGTGYLTDTNIAAQQADTSTSTSYGVSVGTVSPGHPCTIPSVAFVWGGTQHLLFEGAGIGEGQLTLTIYQNGYYVAVSSVWLDLHDIKDLYEQSHVANVYDSPAGSSSYASTYVEDHVMPANSDEAPQFILFVHGWRMGVWDYESFSDTMFKRLYWADYQGRFASLRWPTLSADDFWLPALDYFTYNRSEFRAWKSAAGLSAYLTHLKQRFPNYSLNVCAHSMGNIVMAEALKDQLAIGQKNVDNYVLMQAAVPAHCYQTNLPNYAPFMALENGGFPTPDEYRGYPGAINQAINGNMSDFFNTNDYALATGATYIPLIGNVQINWEANQENFKPDGGYEYGTDGTNCWWNNTTGITDSREILAFCSRPRSKAVGALGGVGGNLNTSAQVDLTAQFHFLGNSDEHSAQFNWNIQNVEPFYSTMLNTFFPPK